MADISIVGGNVLLDDGTVEPADVRLRDGAVHTIDAGIDTAGSRVIEASGATVLPGLVDAHVHLSLAGPAPLAATSAELTARACLNLTALLESGVTTVRDVGGFDDIAIALGRAVEKGWITGPAIHAANRIICSPGGHGSSITGVGFEANGADEMRLAVRRQAQRGATLIKVAINGGRNVVELSQAELATIVEEAHRLGLKVACHASVPDAVELAIRCGVDTIEHGNGTDPDQLEQMAAAGIVLVPTAFAFTQGLADAVLQVERLAGDRAAAAARDSWQLRVDGHQTLIRDAVRAGVTLAVGTDALIGQEVAVISDELRALADLGLNPAAALRAATVGSAAAIGDPASGTADRRRPGRRRHLPGHPGRHCAES